MLARSPLALALALATAALAAAGPQAAAPAAAAQPSRVVVSPKPGQEVKRNSVRIVVRASPEPGDLRARLNGVGIGRGFAVLPGGRRALRVSASHGLRRGANVLSVRAWSGQRWRRAKVRFTVSRQVPLAGAGRDRTVMFGTATELAGRLPSARGGPRAFRWRIVRAPRHSRLGAGAGGGNRGPTARSASGLRGARSLTPTFRPDALGNYVIELGARTTRGLVADRVTVHAVPASKLVPVRTAVAGEAGEPRPGIKVGGQVYRAPWLRTNGADAYAGNEGGRSFQAIFQVLALQRTTLAPIWNRTYGVCEESASRYACRTVEGEPAKVPMRKELAALGPNALVLAVSQPGTPTLESGRSGRWAPPGFASFASENLAPIGFPVAGDQQMERELTGAAPGEAAAIGVPGVKPGEAQALLAGAPGGLVGFLTPDANVPAHFGFAASLRVAFDTRVSGCGNGCPTVAQQFGEATESGSVEAGHSGFLVTALDRHSLGLNGVRTFLTASGGADPTGSEEDVLRMASFVEQWADAGSLITITAVHGPSSPEPTLVDAGVEASAWERLALAVAGIGGTGNAFNLAAVEPAGSYTVVGWDGLLEGQAPESRGLNGEAARLRGALVRDGRSLLVSANVSESGPPSEALANLVLRPADSSWPLEGEPREMEAFSFIGSRVDGLGPEPRASYLTQEISEAADSGLLGAIERVTYPPGATFSAAEFAAAKEQLLLEVGYVAKVRTYLGRLARPTEESGGRAWEEATKLQDELERQLNRLRAESKVAFNFFSLLQSLAQLAGIPEFKDVKKLAQAVAATMGLSQNLYNYEWSGSPNGPNRIRADQLATELERRSEATADSFEQIGNIVISDWSKLSELGEHAECAPAQCGERYEDFAFTRPMLKLAQANTLRARDRTIYETLVPASFPIWDTGLAHDPETEIFSCLFAGPLTGAPALAHAKSLDVLDPAGNASRWRTYVSVARERLTYGWAPASVLERMFGAVPESSNPSAGGLGIDPVDFMRTAHRAYAFEPGEECGWE